MLSDFDPDDSRRISNVIFLLTFLEVKSILISVSNSLVC